MFDWLRRRAKREQDIQDEIKYHLEMLAEDGSENGASSHEAKFSARRKFGNPTSASEKTREVWIWPAVERLLQDIRYAVRGFRKHPAFTLTAALSLALGVGANTAIFSLIDAFLLRTLPVHNPQELLLLTTVQNGHGMDSFPYLAIKALEQRATVFSGICGFSASAKLNAGPPNAVQVTSGVWVTGGYYETLGVRPFLGRELTPEDDHPGGSSEGSIAVLSYDYWQSRYHADPNVIGKAILVEGSPVTIVGVSEPGFQGGNVGSSADITLPLAELPRLFPERAHNLAAGSWWLRVLARPKPDVSVERAKAQLTVLWPEITKELVISIESAAVRQAILASILDLTPGGTGWTYLRQRFTRPLMVLMTIVSLVLLVACVNVANLLLTRATARSKEMGVRMAIGAGRWRLLRQLLTESVMLSLFGAAIGVAFAYVGDQFLVDLFARGSQASLVLDVRPDLRVLLFTAAIAVTTGILFGLTPALRATALGIGGMIKDTHPQGWRRSLLSSTLVVSQVALSVLLLVGAGLFVRTLQNLQNLDMGFRREGVLLLNLDPRHAGYKDERLMALYKELEERVQRIPGVKSASVSWNTPLSGLINSDPVLVDGRIPLHESHHSASFNNVSHDYFATMGIPLLLGRDFRPTDRRSSQPVAVVNEEFVKTFLDGQDPLGRKVSSQDSSAWQNMEIVGVVKNTVGFDPHQSPPPSVYASFFQIPFSSVRECTIEARAAGSLTSVADAIRGEIHRRLPDTALTILPLTTQVENSILQERLLALLATVFGVLALALAAVGLYGLMAYTVSRRTSEIGVRIALGATRANVSRLILRDALNLLAIGAILGLPLALAGATFVSKMLFGIRPADPLTAVSALLLLFSAGIIAVYLPSRRASKVDPVTALRYE